MSHPTALAAALDLTLDGEEPDRRLAARLSGEFSNGPIDAPPEAGFPFGGLLAALCAGAMRQGLDIKPPLRSLSVQYLAAARYGQTLHFRPRMLRNGRSVAYAVVEASQGAKLTHHASATYGADADTAAALIPLSAPPPSARRPEGCARHRRPAGAAFFPARRIPFRRRPQHSGRQ